MTLSDIERRDPTCPVLSVHLYTSVCPAASVSGCMVTVLVCLDSGMTGVPILVRTPVYFLGGRGAIVLKVPFNTGRATFVRIEVKILRLFVVNHHRRSAQVWHVFSRNFTVLPAHPCTFIRNRNEPYLPLSSQPQLVLIYRPRRDGRLSRRMTNSYQFRHGKLTQRWRGACL